MKSFAVIPAAGASQRMGRPKLLLPWREGRVVDAVLSAWQNSHVSRVVVVLRHDDKELAACCAEAGVEVAELDSPTPDMKASVRAGLKYIAERHAPRPNDVWLVAPADIPTLNAKVINAVIAAVDPNRPTPVVPTHESRRGHPALFPWPYVDRVDALPVSQGINALLTGADVKEIDCPGAAAEDIDTPDDYRRRS